MGHRGQHIPAVVSRRCQRRIGGGGTVQVEREVVRQNLLLEDVLQQRLVARAHDDLMVRYVLVLLIGAEIDHEERHGEAHPLHLGVAHGGACLGRQQRAIGLRHVPVAHHRVGLERFAVYQLHAGCAAAGRVDRDLLDFALEANRAAKILERLHEPPHECPSATHGEQHAPLLLQLVDERVHRGRLVRIAADQQRMEREHLAEALVLEILVSECRDRDVGPGADQVGEHFDHRTGREERLVDERHAHVEDLPRLVAELQVAGDVVGIELTHLTHDGVAVAVVMEDRPVFEPDVIERIEQDELDVLFGFPAGQREELVDEPRCGDDRGAGIERETILFEHVPAAAGLVELFDNRDIVALCLQANGGGESAEAAADDNNAHERRC